VVGGQRHAPAALVLGKWPGTHRTGGWVGPWDGQDWCRKSRPYQIPFKNSLAFCTSSVLSSLSWLRYFPFCLYLQTQTSKPRAEFEPATPANDQPQILDWDSIPRTVQPVASRYSNWAIPGQKYQIKNKYSRTSNNGQCRGIQILSVIGGVR
jgi:hypothetical protein